MQQRQRIGDLEEQLESLQKKFQTAKKRVIEQVMTSKSIRLSKEKRMSIFQAREIESFQTTKASYDAQLAVFTNELLNTQVSALQRRANDHVEVVRFAKGELKQKQNQVDTLCNDLIPR
jgi:hypothetical protein